MSTWTNNQTVGNKRISKEIGILAQLKQKRSEFKNTLNKYTSTTNKVEEITANQVMPLQEIDLPTKQTKGDSTPKGLMFDSPRAVQDGTLQNVIPPMIISQQPKKEKMGILEILQNIHDNNMSNNNNRADSSGNSMSDSCAKNISAEGKTISPEKSKKQLNDNIQTNINEQINDQGPGNDKSKENEDQKIPQKEIPKTQDDQINININFHTAPNSSLKEKGFSANFGNKKFDLQQIEYQLEKEISNTHILKHENFMQRTLFDIFKRQTKNERIKKLTEQIKPKLSESKRIQAFNRLIQDANRRLEANANLNKSNSRDENKRTVSAEKWNEVYQSRFASYKKAKEDILQKKIIEKEKELKKNEDKVIEEINCRMKKIKKTALEEVVNRLYNDSERRKMIVEEKEKELDVANLYGNINIFHEAKSGNECAKQMSLATEVSLNRLSKSKKKAKPKSERWKKVGAKSTSNPIKKEKLKISSSDIIETEYEVKVPQVIKPSSTRSDNFGLRDHYQFPQPQVQPHCGVKVSSKSKNIPELIANQLVNSILREKLK